MKQTSAKQHPFPKRVPGGKYRWRRSDVYKNQRELKASTSSQWGGIKKWEPVNDCSFLLGKSKSPKLYQMAVKAGTELLAPVEKRVLLKPYPAMIRSKHGSAGEVMGWRMAATALLRSQGPSHLLPWAWMPLHLGQEACPLKPQCPGKGRFTAQRTPRERPL